jgi:putative hydrolase of the HAD superfamily
VNTFKPEPEIFGHALRRLNLTAQEALYVGDNYYADVVGARRAGLRPVLYDPRGIFPEPGCETIKSFDELNTLVKVI